MTYSPRARSSTPYYDLRSMLRPPLSDPLYGELEAAVWLLGGLLTLPRRVNEPSTSERQRASVRLGYGVGDSNALCEARTRCRGHLSRRANTYTH